MVMRWRKCKVFFLIVISTMVFVLFWSETKIVSNYLVEIISNSKDLRIHSGFDKHRQMNWNVVSAETTHVITTMSTTRNIEKQSNTKNKIWNIPEEYPEFFKPRTFVINPLDFQVITTNNIDCNDTNPPFLTVLILTMHHQIEYRKAIRETWGNISFYNSAVDNRERVKIVFLLGKNKNKALNDKVIIESQQARDMVMFDFQDSYFNLTYKVLLGFKWIKEHCYQTKFVMKVDEDTFVDIQEVLIKLRSPTWNTKICGPYFTQEYCHRTGKLKVAVSGYPFKVYPPHVKGNIYFMPTNIALNILNVSYYMPYCNIEDAYITGILAKAIGGVEFRNIRKTYYSPRFSFKGCRFVNTYKFASQRIKPHEARIIWMNLRNKSLCQRRLKS